MIVKKVKILTLAGMVLAGTSFASAMNFEDDDLYSGDDDLNDSPLANQRRIEEPNVQEVQDRLARMWHERAAEQRDIAPQDRKPGV